VEQTGGDVRAADCSVLTEPLVDVVAEEHANALQQRPERERRGGFHVHFFVEGEKLRGQSVLVRWPVGCQIHEDTDLILHDFRQSISGEVIIHIHAKSILIAVLGLDLPLREQLETLFREDPDPVGVLLGRLLAHAIDAVIDLDGLLFVRVVLQLDFS